MRDEAGGRVMFVAIIFLLKRQHPLLSTYAEEADENSRGVVFSLEQEKGGVTKAIGKQ